MIFALTGSIGPIIGQNYGARLMPRVQRAITDAFILAVGYALIAWGRARGRGALSPLYSTRTVPAPSS